MLLTRYWYWYY